MFYKGALTQMYININKKKKNINVKNVQMSDFNSKVKILITCHV